MIREKPVTVVVTNGKFPGLRVLKGTDTIDSHTHQPKTKMIVARIGNQCLSFFVVCVFLSD